MKNLKKMTAVVLAIIMCFAMLAGCAKTDVETPAGSGTGSGTTTGGTGTGSGTGTSSGSTTTEPTTPAEPFVYYWTRSSEETTLNPLQSTTTNNTPIITRTQSTLYTYLPQADRKTAKLSPNGAASEPTSKDGGYTWEIKIDSNAKWSNGDKLTAKDYEYTFKMALDPVMAQQSGSLIATDAITIVNATEYWSQGTANTVKWEDVGIKALDDETLQIKSVKNVTAFDVMKHFYLGYTGKAVAQVLISVLSCFALTPITSIWGLIEGIMILVGNINTDAKGNPLGE